MILKQIYTVLVVNISVVFSLSSNVPLKRLNSLNMQFKSPYTVDVAVLGSGIAGSTISYLLQSQHNCKVALIDPRVNGKGIWYPNYGEWRDEWHFLSERLKLPELKGCTTTEWEVTDCFFGGSYDLDMDTRTRLPRPYVRVDRIKMQKLLKSKFDEAGGISIETKLSAARISDNLFDKGLVHDKDGSTLTLDNGENVRCKIVIDATGFETKLIAKEDPFFARGTHKVLEPGYQIAYGFIAHVDSLGPYDPMAMTLFDYRTSYIPGNDDKLSKDAFDKPTFMYTMPLGPLPDGKYRVFFEETSLVGKDERRLSFEECKSRAMKRLAYHGIQIFGVEEEEYCYIPMGGELPAGNQRVIAFGAAANMVHPSTGYQACRMLASSTDIASVVSKIVQEPNISPDLIAAQAYAKLWNPQNRLQRDFQAFGGDFLMQQTVEKLRGFFAAFFSVEQEVWAGFLAGWPSLPGNIHHETWTGRLKFCLDLFFKMPNPVRVAIIWYSILYTIEFGPGTLFRSLVPFLGSGPKSPSWDPPPKTIGDENAKEEARSMMSRFKKSANNPNGMLLSSVEEATEVIPSPFNS